MIKMNRVLNYLLVCLLALCALGATEFVPTTPAEKLERGIELYNSHQDEEALDYFVDVMMSGNREEMSTANRYLNLMHERLGGIQKPQPVPVRYGPNGELLAPETPWYAQESEHESYNNWVNDQRVAGKEDAVASGWVEEGAFQTEPEYGEDLTDSQKERQAEFTDLTSPQAQEVREIYTQQKLASMTDAVIDRINQTKGVHLYMRDERPDALDIEPDVIFDHNKFRPEAQPLLNDIYELLALTQGSAYVILPPGSYTDDVTLPSMRQAMALNSYLINRGISQGKVHYNMGLVDEEPPARFANLNGLSIVFDYDQKLPTVLEKNENNETAPLLSMAIVPLCHALDRSLGEAFAIDFSVLETVKPLENWTLQVVQHGHDGKYYVVRQLEGFGPVYHQILWNGRKGIIGPELPCGKYTLVLTGIDTAGNKQTLRRRVIVKCSAQEKQEAECDKACAASCTEACTSCKTACLTKKDTLVDDSTLNYKAARLWSKPKRKMGGYARKAAVHKEEAVATVAAEDTAVSTTTKTVNNTTIIQEYDDTDPLLGANTTTTATTTTQAAAYPATDDELLPVNNPYDMPYEDYKD